MNSLCGILLLKKKMSEIDCILVIDLLDFS